MSPVLVVVIQVVLDQSPQMFFVQYDDMIEDLPAAASHPALCDAILPGRFNTRALRLQTRGRQKGNHIAIKFRVVIQDGIAIRTSLGKSFSQLLHHPLGGWMTSNI